MTSVTTLGFPRIGLRRELKKALEKHWQGELSATELEDTARALRQQHWALQKQAGVDVVPCGDFSLYDHVLDTALRFGAVPDSHAPLLKVQPLAGYFALARGLQGVQYTLRALEMTKWFDTNYHYLVPELHAGQDFSLHAEPLLAQLAEARAQGLTARPVLLGPVSFLLLSKTTDGSPALDLLDALLPRYTELLAQLHAAGAEWVQIDEPCLATDLDEAARQAYPRAFAALHQANQRPRLLLASYFGPYGDNLPLALASGFDGLHADLVRGAEDIDAILNGLPPNTILSAGLVDGRNIWRSDLDTLLTTAKRLQQALGADRLWLAPSCSLLHSPIDLDAETRLDPELRSWLAFAKQKIIELRVLADALHDPASAATALADNRSALVARRTSPRVHKKTVDEAVTRAEAGQLPVRAPYAERKAIQAKALPLPDFPTTTIGSFPQTAEVRRARADWRAGRLSETDYITFVKAQIADCIGEQEEIDLDVLVHGEFERNDMVEYFGELLEGFAFTKLGWVQSYGSRCVKPPIIWGDVQRSAAMTVEWSRYAQSLTQRPVKAMLTGPVTILQWSFVRDDQPRARTCLQIALALRDEVADLEAAGLPIVQIDEPALREGLPLRRADWSTYLRWAVEAFRLSAGGASSQTQIHTHMCYSEFNDIIEAVGAMDADVLSIETSRSRMELLDAFVRYRYPNQIGPGVYDIHSPRVPPSAEMKALIDRAVDVLDPKQIWINPDCGLKTRGWPETRAALVHMVEAAKALREQQQAA